VPEIRSHPWYARPLPPLYAQAMGAIMQEQACIDQQVRCLQQQRQQGKAQQVRCTAYAGIQMRVAAVAVLLLMVTSNVVP
jgi:hypothetical protein